MSMNNTTKYNFAGKSEVQHEKIKTILGRQFSFSYCKYNEHYCFPFCSSQRFRNTQNWIYIYMRIVGYEPNYTNNIDYTHVLLGFCSCMIIPQGLQVPCKLAALINMNKGNNHRTPLRGYANVKQKQCCFGKKRAAEAGVEVNWS